MEHHAQALAGLHILVVEDEVMIAMMMEDMLQDLGCSVESAFGVEKALASICGHAPDGVLLDMNIHGEKTTAIAEELVRRSVPFLLVTGYSPGIGDPLAIRAAPRLLKPFHQDDFARRVQEVFVTAAGRG